MNELIPVCEISTIKALVVEIASLSRLKKLGIFLINSQGFWISCHNKCVFEI